MPTEAYSNLEVLHNDHQANAPQRDHAKYPPELDTAVLAPQALAHTDPEVAYGTALPEVLGVFGDRLAASDGKAKSVAFRTHWLSRRLVLINCIVSASVAVIVAVSVRFGLAAKKSTSLDKVLLRPHGILNDSALAAVELPNGDRRVFFQENSGNIRQAVYVGSSKQWSAGFTDIGVSNPKMHTPLAAMAYNRKDNFIEIHLFYIAANNSLSFAYWNSFRGWEDKSDLVASHKSAEGSRQLSVSFMDSPFQIFLFYENTNGNLTVLSTSDTQPLFAYYLDSNSWFDVTDNVRYQLSHQSSYNVPYEAGCHCGTPQNFHAPFASLGAPFYESFGLVKNQLAILLATESNDALSISSCDGLKSCGVIGEKSLRGDLTDLDLKVASFDDIGTSGPTGIWINSSDQSLWMTDSFRESPDPPFPFSRVAAITSNISLEYSVIVYHQISDGVLVENIWQFANRIWIKSSIPIPTS